MAGGHPKYGGTNSVTVLDLGQPGGSRASAGEALFTLFVLRGPEQAFIAENAAAQQVGLFEDVLGYAGGSTVWSGQLNVEDADMLDEIIKELDAKLHGHPRNSSGILQQSNANEVRDTQLTDYDGRVLTNRARIRAWRFLDRRLTTPEGRIVVPLEIEFRIL